MNPLEQQLLALNLPNLPDTVRDRVLWESGRRQGVRSARKWQGLSLALTLGLGVALMPRAVLEKAPTLSPETSNHPPLQVVSQPDPAEEPREEDEPWLARYLKQNLVDRELQFLQAGRVLSTEPLAPPPWTNPPTESSYLQQIESLIHSEDK